MNQGHIILDFPASSVSRHARHTHPSDLSYDHPDAPSPDRPPPPPPKDDQRKITFTDLRAMGHETESMWTEYQNMWERQLELLGELFRLNERQGALLGRVDGCMEADTRRCAIMGWSIEIREAFEHLTYLAITPSVCFLTGGDSAYPHPRQTPERPPMREYSDELVEDTPNISRPDVAGLHIRFDQMLIMVGLLRDKLNRLYEEVQGLKQQQQTESRERIGKSKEKDEEGDGQNESESGSAVELDSVDQDDGVVSASPFSSTFSIATPDTEEETAGGEVEPALSWPRTRQLSLGDPVSPTDIAPLAIPSLAIPPLASSPPGHPGLIPRPAPGSHGAFTGYWPSDNWKYWPGSTWQNIGFGAGNVEEIIQRIEGQTSLDRAGSISISGGGGGAEVVHRRGGSSSRQGVTEWRGGDHLSGSLEATNERRKSRSERIMARPTWRKM
ncbi:hypothetical protein LTR33_013842 [Friedmanniomyces endolithicus]|nr:hypothetical protein LTR33_013842 [Friedmanniomyces endolithicus]